MKTPRTMKPMCGQPSASGRPISSGTERNLAAPISGSATDASSMRGSIHQAPAKLASSTALMPCRFQLASPARQRSGRADGSSQPTPASSGSCSSICAVMLASSASRTGGSNSAANSRPAPTGRDRCRIIGVLPWRRARRQAEVSDPALRGSSRIRCRIAAAARAGVPTSRISTRRPCGSSRCSAALWV